MSTAGLNGSRFMSDEEWALMVVPRLTRKEAVSVSVDAKRRTFIEYYAHQNDRTPRFAEMSILEFER